MTTELKSPIAAEHDDAPRLPRITLWSFLRTMWAVLWTAFRHPLTTTLIDPYTGKVLKR